VIGPRSFLIYRRYRYLRVSLLFTALAIGAYAYHDPVGGPSGGSWLGYSLGAMATLTILWLMWFGVRRRRYHSTGAPVQGWLSAHVYLGTILLWVVPLHSGFQFDWNVHTLAYALMVGAILSGAVGILFYGIVPTPMTRNRSGEKLEAILEEIADLDAECRLLAVELPDTFAQAVALAVDETRIGGGLLRQLAGRDEECGTTRALEIIRDPDVDLDSSERDQARRLLALLSLKQALLARARVDLRYKALLDLWLLVHVPLAFATVAAVGVHVFIVFYYW
jgi:hypothetical protein